MNNITLKCPVCGGKTHTQVKPDTVLERFPLFCPKCKRESIVTVRDGNLTYIKS